MSISIENAEAEYLHWRTAQQYAKNTVRNDRSAIKFLKDTVGADYPVEHIDYDDALAVLERASDTRSASSVNMVQSSLSAFFKWCRQRRYMGVDNDPFLGMRYRKVPKKERRRLAVHEFPAFLDSAVEPRERAACALGLYLFLRSSEVVNLRLRDVDLQAGTIGVTVHKTGDYDIMPISAELDVELRRWLTVYAQEAGPFDPSWRLIPSKTQAGFGTHKINPPAKVSRPEEIVKRTAAAYGWTDTYWQGFHLLRASGARAWFDELIEQTVDGALKIVQAHLHHASVTMTERYLGLTADRAKRDRILKGESMFPSIVESNVTQIRSAG